MILYGANSEKFFDSKYTDQEQLPRRFTITFEEAGTIACPKVRVKFNDNQVGDIVDDNSYEEDYYRYHDIFHYSFAALLGWSPCARAMMKRKRKSNQIVDKIEDGAKAAITEEAISLIIFNEAKRKKFFAGRRKVSKTTLRIISEMTDSFEVKKRTQSEWESAILKSYQLFRALIMNRGGTVHFDMIKRTAQLA